MNHVQKLWIFSITIAASVFMIYMLNTHWDMQSHKEDYYAVKVLDRMDTRVAHRRRYATTELILILDWRGHIFDLKVDPATYYKSQFSDQMTFRLKRGQVTGYNESTLEHVLHIVMIIAFVAAAFVSALCIIALAWDLIDINSGKGSALDKSNDQQ